MLTGVFKAAADQGLLAMGVLRPGMDDPVPDGAESLLLLGPDGARFWDLFATSPEWQDGAPDPVDRWSTRVITALAESFGGTALFPFGQVPPLPFIGWALRSGRAYVSPAQLLVHAEAGLWASYRGAVALPYAIDMPALVNPCDNCADRPCLDACPPSALTAAGYDLPACHAFLDTRAGSDCMGGGCAVRRACPVSARHGRQPEQSAHHMRAFHK